MAKGKKYTAAKDAAEDRAYSTSEAITFVKEHAGAKFDESVEVHIRLGIDPKKGDQAVRGTLTFPHGIGKTARVGVITDDTAAAKKAGADVVGGEEMIDAIKGGDVPDVDVIVTSPDMMPKLAAAAKILGPKGLMPSPKTDTVTPNIAQAVEELKKGKENFKNDATANIHQVIGKASFDETKLLENFEAFMDAVRARKNEAHKGQYITKITMCSTMGPSVRVKV